MFLNIRKNKIISIILQMEKSKEHSSLIFETLFDVVTNKKITTSQKNFSVNSECHSQSTVFFKHHFAN